MPLTNKVAQFTADSDLVNEWVHGGPTTSITTDSGPVRSPTTFKLAVDSIFPGPTRPLDHAKSHSHKMVLLGQRLHHQSKADPCASILCK